jgi:hypothetical protein
MCADRSDEQTVIVTMANTLTRSAEDAALISLALIDFLQHDPRPTCVVDMATAYIAYRNVSLERLPTGTWNLVGPLSRVDIDP